MNKHYIVLNGKRYDAITGALLGTDTAEQKSKPAAAHAPQPAAERTSRDGTAASQAKSTTSKRPGHDRQPSHIAHHKPQSGKTLMRRVVKRPSSPDIIPLKKQYPVAAKSDAPAATPKVSAHTVDPSRLQRAKAIHKSKQIGKFISYATSPIRPVVTPVAMATPPNQRSAQPAARSAKSASNSPIHNDNIFEQALASATSHEMTYTPPGRKKLQKRLKFAAGASVALFLLFGVVFVNRTTLEMQVASWRAGFPAARPAYVPSGYTQDTTAVEGKSVSIQYVSPTDKTTYSLTQEPSDWNSQTLLNSIVAQAGPSYRTLQQNGRTIYVYGGNKAAWVDGGILYTIAGSAPLTADQITSIAASL